MTQPHVDPMDRLYLSIIETMHTTGHYADAEEAREALNTLLESHCCQSCDGHSCD